MEQTSGNVEYHPEADTSRRPPQGPINPASGVSDAGGLRQLNLKSTLVTGNIQGICSLKNTYYKMSRLRDIAREQNALMMTLTESHLNENILDAEIVIDGYEIFKRNRQAGIRKGGIITYIRSDIAVSAKEAQLG